MFHSFIVIFAKWTGGLRRCCFHQMSVCVCMHYMAISPNRLKLQTPNLMCTFPGTVQMWAHTNFLKVGVARVTWPINFWVLHAANLKRVELTTANLAQSFKLPFCKSSLGGHTQSAECLLVRVNIREGSGVLLCCDGRILFHSEVDSLILFLVTNHVL